MNLAIVGSTDIWQFGGNPGHPNFRNWALHPVPTMQVGAAALGYPDTSKVTTRHRKPPTVISNEFTSAGVTQSCAEDLARIINDAFASLWSERREYYTPASFPKVMVIIVGVFTAIFALIPLIMALAAGIYIAFAAYVICLPMFVPLWCNIYMASPKVVGPGFTFGIKALDKAQPALRECLVRHGVNGTVHPSREMEGLHLLTFCTKSIARFWVRLEVSTPQTNHQVVQTYMAGLPAVSTFYDQKRFNAFGFVGYEAMMAPLRQMVAGVNGTCDVATVQQMIQTAQQHLQQQMNPQPMMMPMQQMQMMPMQQMQQMAPMQQMQMVQMAPQMQVQRVQMTPQLQMPAAPQMTEMPISTPAPATAAVSIPAPVTTPTSTPAPAPAPAQFVVPEPAPAPTFKYKPPTYNYGNDDDTTTWM